jgi:hypothetical protein
VGHGVKDRLGRKPAQPGPDYQSLVKSPIPESVSLAILLALEIWVFSASFHKFFNHDSLFYMVNVPRSWAELGRAFLAPSVEKNYRPLNLAFFSLIRPLLGTDPYPYHYIPVIFHLLNTVLLFLLFRRILPQGPASIAAAAFWGLHSVAGWITYDITYLSDFLLAFLLLVSLILVVEGRRKQSGLLVVLSIIAFVLSLLTKESATTFPLAVWIFLALADLRDAPESASLRSIGRSFRRTLPLACIYLAIAVAFACLFGYWLQTGKIYTGDPNAAYRINPWTNPLAKAKYVFWALNFPDALSIPRAAQIRHLAFLLMGGLLVVWAFDIFRRRGRLSAIEWAGLAMFAGLNLPSLLLSTRLGKWYLYLPLIGIAMAFGVLVGHLRDLFPARLPRVLGYGTAGILIFPLLFSSYFQTQSYVTVSDCAYQSDTLQAYLSDFQRLHPTLPSQITLFSLPAFDPGISDLFSIPPVDRGQLIELYYPGTRVNTLFGHRGDKIPGDISSRSDLIVLQYLDRRLYDVTEYCRATGKMTLYLLPTMEGQGAPLLKLEPAGGWDRYRELVHLMIGDDGAALPEDYGRRSDLWVLQYLNGRFSDVTGYYKGRRLDSARRVIRDVDSIRYSVDRGEYYPDYEHFGTPTGAPVFFPTPQKEILTQIGGTTVVAPLGTVMETSHLRLDVSWMFELGDGGWAEVLIRSHGQDISVFREYMKPDPARRTLLWKEVRVDLGRFAGEDASLVLRCYNDPGNYTVADWLNWRDITVETGILPQEANTGSLKRKKG